MRHAAAALLLFLLPACAAPPPRAAAPTVDLPLTETLNALRNEALGRERVDWDSVERALRAKLPTKPTPADVEPLILEAIAQLNDAHARYIPVRPPTPATPPAASATSTSTAPAPTRPPLPTLAQSRLLDGNIAYLLIPMRPAGTYDQLAEYALSIRVQLADLESHTPPPRGWIIDLRLNGGGTVWPMLVGLAPLLGDGPQLTSLSAGNTVTATFGLTGYTAWLDDATRGRSIVFEIDSAKPPPLTPRPIAVLIGPWTMSSGESLAITLQSLATTRTFGEPTAGLTTVTQTYTLSDRSTLILPTAQMGDRAGKAVVGKLTPTEPVELGPWPTPTDATANAARVWLLAK